MNGIGTLLLTCAVASAMGGVFYAGVRAERSAIAEHAPIELSPVPAHERLDPPEEVESEDTEPDSEPDFDPVLTLAIDLDELDEEGDLFATPDDIVLEDGLRIGLYPTVDDELAGGVRIGAFGFEPFEDALREATETSMRTRRTRRVPARPPGPRLHSNPGIHSVLTARRMMANNELIQGSCYAYLSEVYARAGHSSWRKRRIVYRRGRTGPYADLDLIRPGDWLYIVNDPGRTPVGTHSVMFVRWEDRARGWARVISHPGWFAGPHTGRERTYDISQTYRIIRPTL